MQSGELSALCALHSIRGIGNRTLTRIYQQQVPFTEIYSAPAASLKNFGLKPNTIDQLLAYRARHDMHEQISGYQRQGISVKTLPDEDYPELLRNIYNPPFILYYKGDFSLTQQFGIAIVGSRAATVYGRTQTHQLAFDLARYQVTVISGMARGIDTQAHKGALAAGGKTIAVLGSGVDVIYPGENYWLAQEIIDTGLLISEFAPGTRPEPGNFPMRNRTISGLAHGLAVMEAKLQSGALITADFALEQGRDVFALPGPVNNATSQGCNYLIQQGAMLLTGAADILAEYGIEVNEIKAADSEVKLDQNQLKVIECLQSGSLHIDALRNTTGMHPGLLSSVLLQLELQGLIQVTVGNMYSLL